MEKEKQIEISRLEELREKIDQFEDHERYFDKVFKILQQEFSNKDAEKVKGVYWNNLRQTIQKQAENYIEARSNSVSNKTQDEYDELISNFKRDINHEITRLKFC